MPGPSTPPFLRGRLPRAAFGCALVLLLPFLLAAHGRPGERPAGSLQEPLASLVGKPGDEEPPVWEATIEIRRERGARVTDWEKLPPPLNAASRVSEWVDLKVEFKIDRHRRPLPGETASYKWKYDMVTTASGSTFVSQRGDESGGKLGYKDDPSVKGWDFTLRRTLHPAEGAVSELNVEDVDGPAADLLAQIAARRNELLPGEAPPDTCVLRARATFPGKATTYNGVSGKAEIADSRPVVEEEGTIEPYRYDQRRNQGNLAEPPAGAPAPPAAGPEAAASTRVFKYTLTFLPTFEFEPKGFVVRVGGADVTGKFKVRKFWREWASAGGQGPYRLAADWETGEAAGAPKPGAASRRLRECLVHVEEFPEMGFFYYVEAWTTEPARVSRLRRYQPIRITAGDWARAKAAGQPFRTESNAGAPITSFRVP